MGNMLVNLRTFYNKEFLDKTKMFIIQNFEYYLAEKPNPNSTPIMSQKKVQKSLNLDSPLVTTVSTIHSTPNKKKSIDDISFSPNPLLTPRTKQLYAYDSYTI